MTENSAASPTPTDDAALRQAVLDGMPRVVDELIELARIPSVSMPSFDQRHVDASAEATAHLLEEAGLEVEIVREGGAPAVIGRLAAPEGAPTVLLYAHHDVQPPGDEADWDSPAFEPTRRGERLFGRGCADDKAGIMAHVAALRAHGGRPPVGVTVFVEGEEEYGSESLPVILEKHGDKLACDAIVLADSANWKVGVPALTTSLRGMLRVQVTVSTLQHAVHSGMYGGPAMDSLTAFSRLAATLHDEQGDVAVAGLAVDPVNDLEMDEADFRAESGMLPDSRLVGTGSLTERLWGRPTASVIGIDAPRVDSASNTLLPTTTGLLSFRLAPSQDPEAAYDAIREHLQENAPWGATVETELQDAGSGFSADATGPAYDAARSAFGAAWGTDAVDVGLGGSIPFIAMFAERFPEASILVTGVEDPDTRAHGANESLHLGEFEKVCVAEALLLAGLAR
ncbi:M20/M25/M40 family metallo-hydrolase [Kytococcus sp. Marseille-QA3725]